MIGAGTAGLVTAAGAGYSRWNDLAVTRWREDATRDDAGSFHVMEGSRFAEAVVDGRRHEIDAFVTVRDAAAPGAASAP